MNKSNKTLIKVSVILVIILLVFGGLVFFIKAKNPEPENDETSLEEENEDPGEDNKPTGSAIFLVAIIFAMIIGFLVMAIKKTPQFYSLLEDSKVIEEVRRIIVEDHNFRLENKKGALHYYLPYYFQGNRNFPRAIVGFDMKSSRDDNYNISPIKYNIVTLDINRKNPNFDTQLLPAMDFEEANKYLKDVRTGKISQSPSPSKQDQIVISQAQSKAIEEAEIDKLKEALK
ncbi:MAG: hypothetical protein IH845_05690 [Nanoarchaeota archaeon]|nr:hypothetical protein [Nanoarchaeota archaeon]